MPCFRLHACLAAAICVALLGAAGASAGTEYQVAEGGTVDVKSGVARPFRYLLNCERIGDFGAGSAFAQHGTVTFQQVERKACGEAKHPALLAIYTSNPGFVGSDDVTVYAGAFPFHFKMIVH